MNSLTKENCIQLLMKLRDVYQGQLDTSVIVEIDKVIAALEMEGECCSDSNETLVERALNIIAVVLRIVTNITEFM